MFRKHILPFLVYGLYSLFKFTWRIRIVESPSFTNALAESDQKRRPFVIAHWHGDELGILYLLKKYRVAAMVSTSKDGELMAKVIRLIGGKTSRGSSTRGGASALKGILRLAKEGWRPSVAVDGPKGPLHKVKPGVFEISRLLKADIFPLSVATNRQLTFHKSWNKTFLPLPFAQVVVIWGDGLPAIRRDEDARSPELALKLEESLRDAKQQACNLIAAIQK